MGVILFGGLLAAVVALKGKEGTGGEGWESGFKAGGMVAVCAVLVLLGVAIPIPNLP